MVTLSSEERDERLKHHLMASKELHPALVSSETEYKVWKELYEVIFSLIFFRISCEICRLCITYSSFLTGPSETCGWITRFSFETKRSTMSSCSMHCSRVCNMLSTATYFEPCVSRVSTRYFIFSSSIWFECFRMFSDMREICSFFFLTWHLGEEYLMLLG